MIRMHWFGLSLAILASLTFGVAQADSVGINFGADEAGGAPASLAAGDSAGVVGQTNWNNAGGSGGGITDAVDDSGAATTLDIEWAAEESWSNIGAAATGDGVLLNGWISENGGGDGLPSTVTVSEIPFPLYDLYLYVGHDRADEDTVFTETGGAFTDFITVEDVDGTTVAADPFVFNAISASGETGNYFRVGGLTQASLAIEMLVGNGERAPLTGLQVVQIPEPSSLVLLGVVAVMLGFVARRKK